MTIKDRVVSWFVKNILTNRMENIDIPGYITEEITEQGKVFRLRNIAFSETILSDLENKLFKERTKLYEIGKKFGYIYSEFLEVPTVDDEDFVKFVDFFVKFIEAIYASKISYDLLLEEQTLKLDMKDYIVCRKNGKGHIFSEGGIAGIWAYMMQDKSVEAVQTKCQGRGDEECEVVAGPYKYLDKKGYDPVRFEDVKGMDIGEDYKNFNKVRETKWSDKSLRDLIDKGFFEYEHGQVTYEDGRFFLCEASFMYILEKGLNEVKNGLETLWEVSFDFGKTLAEKSDMEDPCKFITDFFPALGFGDILAVTKDGKYEISVNYFPWLNGYKNVIFVMFRGMLSGVISQFEDKEIKLNKIEKDISAGYLALNISH